MNPLSTRFELAAVIWLLCACTTLVVGSACQTPETTGDQALNNEMLGDAPRSKATDSSPKKRGILWYRLETDGDRLDIRVRLVGPPPRTTFFLPGRWAGRDDFARDINIHGARGERGPLSFTISRSEGRIDVDSEDVEWVELAYSVELHDRRGPDVRFRPQLSDDLLFVYAPAILILPSEGLTTQIRDIPIEVHLPESWRVMTTWPGVRAEPSASSESTTVHGFLAADPTQLRDAYLAAAPRLDVHRAELSGSSSLEVAFAPGFDSDRDALAGMLNTVVSHYVRVFGDIGDVHVLVLELDDGSERHSRGVGRRGGFVLELPDGSDIRDHRLLTAHEALHLWNGHLLTPTPDVEPRTRWFKEGVTHYIALKALNTLGMMSLDHVLEELERSARYYSRNPAANASRSTETDRARLPYDRGVLIALGIDALLMENSAGEVDITDWLQTLLEAMGRENRHYTLDDLREVLVEVAGSGAPSLTEFWSEHIEEASGLDPARVFEIAGLHWLRRGPAEPGRLLPLKRSNIPFRALFPTMPNAANRGTTSE